MTKPLVFPKKSRGGPPKWMVKIMENPMNKWMIWVVFPYSWVDTHISALYNHSCCFLVIFPCMSLSSSGMFWGIPASLEGCFCAYGACLSSGWNFMTLVPSYSLLNVSEFPAPIVGSAKAIDVIYLQREVEWLQQVPWLFVNPS